jgi:hypothetical protein
MDAGIAGKEGEATGSHVARHVICAGVPKEIRVALRSHDEPVRDSLVFMENEHPRGGGR